MKNLTFTLLFLQIFLGNISAQNYRLFQVGIPAYFEDTSTVGSTREIKAIKVDSFITTGPDTFFFNFASPDLSHMWDSLCVNLFGPSWIGRGLLVKSNGEQVLFNYKSDSIFIKPQESVGSSWRMFTLDSNSYLEASITSSDTINIDGVVDSMKVITMEAKDNFGVNINHYLNGISMIVSRDHGLVLTPPMREFPSGQLFRLVFHVALDSLNLNKLPEVGDTMQWQNYVETSMFTTPESYYTRAITSVSYSANNDTLFYSYWTQSVSSTLHTDSFPYTVTTLVSDGNGSSSIALNYLPQGQLFRQMPEQTDTTMDAFNMLPGAIYYRMYQSNTNCKPICASVSRGLLDLTDSCVPPPFEPITDTREYAMGLGLIGSYHNESVTLGGTSFYDYLSAYNFPSLSCSQSWILIYTSNGELVDASGMQESIYPNPIGASGILHVYIPAYKSNEETFLFLFDLAGRKVLSHKINSIESIFNLNNLESGLYFYSIQYSSGRMASGKILK